MKIAKALILAGDAGGDAACPAVAAGSPHLFPVANRPILFHQLERLRRGGLLEATILAGPRTRDAIRTAVGDGGRWNLTVRHGDCPPGAGLAAALATCRAFIGDEPVLVQEADALLQGRLHAHIDAFADDGLDAMALRLVAAPSAARREPSPGYLLGPRALAFLFERPEAAADPIGEVRAWGGRARVQHVEGCVPCHGGLDALLEANRRMLQELEPDTAGALLERSEVQGPVVVDPSAQVRRSTLRGPVIIGPGARLVDAYVGPYTAVGAHAEIEGAEIEHSIVLPGASLAFVGTRLESSVIGEGARIARAFTKPSALRVSLGHGAEVLLS